MVNENLKAIIENKKPVELVQEIKNYQIKKSPLSLAARSKVINKSGSNFVSEKEGCGPCEYSGCPYSTRFYLEIGFTGGDLEFKDEIKEKTLDRMTMENIQEACDVIEIIQ